MILLINQLEIMLPSRMRLVAVVINSLYFKHFIEEKTVSPISDVKEKILAVPFQVKSLKNR